MAGVNQNYGRNHTCGDKDHQHRQRIYEVNARFIIRIGFHFAPPRCCISTAVINEELSGYRKPIAGIVRRQLQTALPAKARDAQDQLLLDAGEPCWRPYVPAESLRIA